MRSYGKTPCPLWQKPRFKKLVALAKLLYLYVLNCPHGNSIGCFVLPDGYIMADLEWSAECVSKHVAELVSNGFIERDETTAAVRIIDWWTDNTIENDNVAKGALKALEALPESFVRNNAFKGLCALDNKFVNRFINSLGNEFANPEPSLTEPEPSQTEPEVIEHERSAGDVTRETLPGVVEGSKTLALVDRVEAVGDTALTIDAEFDAFWREYPRRAMRGRAIKAFRAARKKIDFGTLIAAVRHYASNPRLDPKFIPHPASWLNGEAWADQENTAPRRSRTMAALDEIAGAAE